MKRKPNISFGSQNKHFAEQLHYKRLDGEVPYFLRFSRQISAFLMLFLLSVVKRNKLRENTDLYSHLFCSAFFNSI